MKNGKLEPEQAEIRTQSLPVKLTQAELEIRAQELAGAETVRTDTGEVIGTRGMTEQERQVSLFEQRARKNPKA